MYWTKGSVVNILEHQIYKPGMHMDADFVCGMYDINYLCIHFQCSDLIICDTDCSAPFQVLFVSNSNAADTTAAQAQRGFCLEYKQISC